MNELNDQVTLHLLHDGTLKAFFCSMHTTDRHNE
jgi:hypothetical protein